MNFVDYYLDQNVFRGVPIQRGYGFGSYFRKFMKWAIPIVREHALPTIKSAAKTVGNELVSSVGNITRDALDGKNLKSSAESRFDESIENLNKKARQYLDEKKKNGRGFKRKKKANIKRDIFDDLKRK